MPFDREYVFSAVNKLAERHMRGENISAQLMVLMLLAGARGVLTTDDAETVSERFKALPNR